MEKCHKNILFSLLLLFSSWSFAEGRRYRVDQREGMAFSTAATGRTKMINPGSFLGDSETLQVDEDGKVTLVGPYGEHYFIAGGSTVSIEPTHLFLKNGFAWIQAPQKEVQLAFETPNGIIHFERGDSIVSYDIEDQRTQLAVLAGVSTLANKVFRHKSQRVPSAKMSFIQDDKHDGLPRESLPIGKKSFVQLRNLFSYVTPLDTGIETFLPDKKQEIVREEKSSQKITFLSLEEKRSWQKPKKENPTRTPASIGIEKTDESTLSKIQYFGFDQKNQLNRQPSSTTVKEDSLSSLIKKIRSIE